MRLTKSHSAGHKYDTAFSRRSLFSADGSLPHETASSRIVFMRQPAMTNFFPARLHNVLASGIAEIIMRTIARQCLTGMAHTDLANFSLLAKTASLLRSIRILSRLPAT